MQTQEQIADDVVVAVFADDRLDDAQRRTLSRAVLQIAAGSGAYSWPGLVGVALTIRDAMLAEGEHNAR